MELLIADGWAPRLALIFLLLNAMTALFVFVGFAVERTLHQRQILAVPLRPGQRARELRNTLMFQLTAALAFTAFTVTDLMPWTAGWTAGLTTFFACWLGFEIYYYAVHRAMHLPGLFRFHREHHESRVNTPLTAFSMSIPESLVWIAGYVLLPLAMTRLGLEVSLAGWLAYLVYNYWGNILGHLNVEVLPAWVGRRVHSWTLHAITFHALHHARYAGHYGFGATFMDRWLASEWQDWPGLQAKVLAGEALTHLKQRG